MRVAGLCEALGLAGLLAVAGAATLAGCGDGGGIIITPDDPDKPSDSCTAANCGDVWVGLAQVGAEVGAGNRAAGVGGKFLSYTVDVVSIRLEKKSGGLVDLLPERQRVDFAALGSGAGTASAGVAGAAALAAVARVPAGTYVTATVRLDYGNAVVYVEDQGLPTPVAVTDSAGAALGVVDVRLEFPDDGTLVSAVGAPALLSLGYDLEATHVIGRIVLPNSETVTVTVPAGLVWVATPGPGPAGAGRLAAAGLRVSVDESAGSYVAELRPLGDDRDDTDNGKVTVLTDADTRFEVDGDVLGRTEALAALSGLGADAWTAAVGVFDAAAGGLAATEVLAGDSVPGGGLDTVVGSVVSRTGNELILRGGSVVRTDERALYAPGDIRVRMGTDTVVRKDSGAALDLKAVSVGQRVSVFGVASSSEVAPVVDARGGGRLRLHPVRVGGFVVSRVTGELRIDLADFDGRDAGFFEFGGTGGSPAGNADPRNYQVDSGDAALGEFAAGEPMQATGFVAPFGSAPPDFEAEAVVESESLPALLGLGWGGGGTGSPFTLLSQSGFTIDVADPALGLARRFLARGPERQDVAQLARALRVEPAAGGDLLFAVVRDGRVESFRGFGDFASRVSSLLGSGRNMRSLTARGQYDEDQVELAAEYVAVGF